MDIGSQAIGTRNPQTSKVSVGNESPSANNESNTNKDINRNRNKNKNRNRNRNRNRDSKKEDKPNSITGNQEGQRGKLQTKNRKRKDNNETNKKNTLEHPKEMNEDKQKQIAKRQDEIDQCICILPGFRLFKKGKHITSFGYQIFFMTDSGKLSQDVLINIPLEYPNVPIRLSTRNNESDSSYMETVIMNFNWKARELTKKNWRIPSQINFLVSELELLKQANFKQIDKLRNSFYKTV
ncbi:hypothetical protein SEUBUCD646_0I00180 [Saccharomyces eubayanus]|uniref:Uncharacterized protein n=2 Tax=Saccharomyces TaxID=4930 RepID=A0A6C1E8Z1_SACPS|nr:hypothetical protein GRS66_008317 [Saccharomyces pastorianus]CAI2034706.1 hypothetical protein SEUBUCD650_0I00180 [Saccharomyces eubayanus]CAI2047090.1 hypothetical protein SEUBUCD646_0I00180 [Saccharomyces eubayanus]